MDVWPEPIVEGDHDPFATSHDPKEYLYQLRGSDVNGGSHASLEFHNNVRQQRVR